ncbi:hypothetical protein DIURU_002144 [Diutina rugosa]|uniref:Uncharacterized protein n=1 Tax=Diutina rugosa TaxID=5481 RepID=A0A642UXV6_DIURU|nr:uncharacterized protein DIURU_002144 [Diutina rugosa]KAA8903922.1 hypothetical protein DIURU_002144 [Diutina rugosa]
MKASRRLYSWQMRIPSLLSERDVKGAFRVAQRVKATGEKPLYSTYLSLLQGIDQPYQGSTAAKLFCEVEDEPSMCSNSKSSKGKAIWMAFLNAIKSSGDLSHVMVVGPSMSVSHCLAKLHILLNNDCLNQALDMWWSSPTYDSAIISKFIARLLTVENTSELHCLLNHLKDKNHRLQAHQWTSILELGLRKCHYGLVKLWFDNYLGPGEAITTSTMVLQGFKAPDMTDGMLERILQCFSLHGDVESVIRVVETYFIHKQAKGELGLTTHVRSYIIGAYCYHKEEKSFKSVMNAIVTLSGGNTHLTYRDVFQHLSHKFHHYREVSDNVALSKIHERMATDTIRFSCEEPVWKKGSNTVRGNALNNMAVLESVTMEIFTYMKDKDIKAIRIILNCLLLHLAEYQNFSAIVKVLSVLHQMNSNFIDWLDIDSWDIMYMSAGNSGAKLCCLALSKVSPGPLSSKQLENCLISSLRGEILQGLQFWIYQYLSVYQVNDRLQDIIANIASESKFDDEGTNALFRCIKKGDVPHNLDDFWTANNLNKDECRVGLIDDSNNPRKYFAEYDKRDYESLHFIFNRHL